MKKNLLFVILMTGLVFCTSCENNNTDLVEPSVSLPKENMVQALTLPLDSCTQFVNPVMAALNDQIDSIGHSYDAEVNRSIWSIFKAIATVVVWDAVGSALGGLGGAIGSSAFACGAIAATDIFQSNSMSNYHIYVRNSPDVFYKVISDSCTAPTVADSIGYFHNAAIQSIDAVGQMYNPNTSIYLFAVYCERFINTNYGNICEPVNSDTLERWFISCDRITRAATSFPELCNSIRSAYPEISDGVSIAETFINNGLGMTVGNRASYRDNVLTLIDNSELTSDEIAFLHRIILTTYASSLLWNVSYGEIM